MRSDLVVSREVALQSCLGCADGVIGMQIDLLVLDAAPEPFHEYVVPPASFAVHADPDVVVLQQTGEFLTGELAALVGVEDLRRAVAVDRFLYRFDTEFRGQRVRQPPCQYPAAGPVHDSKQVHEASLHRDVGDVRRPDVIRLNDFQIAQQVGIDLVCRMPLAGVGFAIPRMDAHAPHQGPDTFSADEVAFRFE